MRLIFALLFLTLIVPIQAQAGDTAAGRKKALMCQTCHGLDGVAKQPNTPNLSGQVESYIVKALTDFKEGLRANEMMSVVIQNLKDEDIADLAAYYSSIKVTVTPTQ
jgi:cytochrome c553